MKVLVTGASGFIGKYVVAELLKTEHTIIVAGRTSLSQQQTAPSGKITFRHFDFNELNPAQNYYHYFDEPDVLIHLAWQGLPNYTKLFHFEENLPQHYQFIKNLVTNGLSAITVAGTCFEYGMHQGELKEDMLCLPDNAYALAKYTLYRFLAELQKQTPFNLTWLRLFYMYGAGQSPNSLFSQLVKALERGDTSFNMSGGEQVRDFLPVEQVAEIIAQLSLSKSNAGIVNCCSGQPVKVKDWVCWFLETQHRHIDLNLGYYPYAPYEPIAFWGGVEKLKMLMPPK